MAHQIDFLAVGEKSRSGDAIAIRWGNLSGDRSEQFVMIVDGGTKESGSDLVNHVKNHYGTDTVDLVVSTHPDSDHASGLTVVLEELNVKRLWMHRPWNHAQEIRELFINPRLTAAGLKTALQRSIENARELETIANRKNIPITEPFSGENMGIAGLEVLGPSREYYEELLPHFRDTPEPSEARPGALRQFIQEAQERIMGWVDEKWHIETLGEPSEEDNNRSAENNSSVVLLIKTTDGKHALLTADAGDPALMMAVDRAESLGLHLPSLIDFVQIPHHGSRKNVGPTILDRILGPRQQTPIATKMAYVSAAAEGEPKHPSKRVTNAFIRRGAETHATQGISKCEHHEAPRDGWSPATPYPFCERFEEEQ